MNTRSILFVILIYITTLVTPTVIPHVETFQLSEDEMKHLVDDPKVTHKVTFTISQNNLILPTCPCWVN